MPLRLLGALVALTTMVAACTSDNAGVDDADSASPAPQILATESPTGDGEETTSEDPGDAEPTPTPAPQGVVVNPFALVTGDCFNEYDLVDANEARQEVTTAVDCNLAHDGEVYFHTFYPGTADAPFPGDSKLEEWGQQQCFAQFEPFVGQSYELSELDLGMILPTLETWTGPGLHRQVTCYVRSWRGGQLQGSMRGTGY